MTQLQGYSKEEASPFKKLLLQRKAKAVKELKQYEDSLQESLQAMKNVSKAEEDNALMLEHEQISQLAIRQKKFIKHLNFALHRIQFGTYGICAVTGKLISKERLQMVPHTTHSIAAKLERG